MLVETVLFRDYSRVHISSDTAFFKILKKASIVQKSKSISSPEQNYFVLFALRYPVE
jgi:hypothetical protein